MCDTERRKWKYTHNTHEMCYDKITCKTIIPYPLFSHTKIHGNFHKWAILYDSNTWPWFDAPSPYNARHTPPLPLYLQACATPVPSGTCDVSEPHHAFVCVRQSPIFVRVYDVGGQQLQQQHHQQLTITAPENRRPNKVKKKSIFIFQFIAFHVTCICV